MSEGRTVPLSSSDDSFRQWIGPSTVNKLFLRPQTIVYIRKYQLAILLSFMPTSLMMSLLLLGSMWVASHWLMLMWLYLFRGVGPSGCWWCVLGGGADNKGPPPVTATKSEATISHPFHTI